MKIRCEIKRLGDICYFENGDRSKNYPSKKYRVDQGIPFINAGHITDGKININKLDYIPRERFDLLGSGKIKKGDILFCLRGSLGKNCVIDNLEMGAIASSLVIIRTKPTVLTNYLFAYFNSPLCADMISRFGNGTAQPNLSAKNLSQFLIPLPSIPEQRRIVAKLDEAFAAIDKAIENTRKNVRNARELYESYLNNIFDNPGDGWEINSLGDYYDITSSKRVYKSEWKQEGIPFYRAREIVRLAKYGFVKNDLFISEKMYSEYSSKYGSPKAGDIMVTGVGTLGVCYVVKKNDKFYFKDGNIIWLKKIGKINSNFIEYAFQSKYLRNQIDNSIGATVGTYTIIKAKNTKILIPPIKEQEHLVNKLNSINGEIAKLIKIYKRKLEQLEYLKESLLYKAFKGNF